VLFLVLYTFIFSLLCSCIWFGVSIWLDKWYYWIT